MRILCVCTGNTCRSPMLAALLGAALRSSGSGVMVESAGTAAGLGDVLDHRNALAPADVQNRVDLGRCSTHVDRRDGLGPRRDRLFDGRRIEAQ